MSIQSRQDAIVADLQTATTWQERYKKIIERGRALPPYPDEFRDDTHRIKGCQSQVWLRASLQPDGTVALIGDSDAAIVKGLVALVLEAFSGATPAEIAAAPTAFLDTLGLGENLSQTRANGLASMLRQVKLYGVAFMAMQQR